MIDIDLKYEIESFKRFLKSFPNETNRAVEISLDKTAYEVRDAVKAIIPKVFDNPVPYTRNSLKVTRTHHHNMQASVWFKEPDRMGDHYLVPQVDGGHRKKKGFERAFGHMFMPSKYAKLNRYGNIPYGTIVQILSVLDRAEYVAGFTSNASIRSKKLNRKPRDYVRLTKKHGKLPPGIYQRVQTGVGFGYKTKKHMQFGEWQKGRRKGRFASVVKARGLRPILLEARDKPYKKRLPFYETANKVAAKEFNRIFTLEFRKQLRRR